MRRFLQVSLLTVLLLPLCASIASAHVLQSDGDIGAVLHIEPDDNPVSNQTTTYVLSFEDDTGHFSLTHCTCTATVLAGMSVISSKPLVMVITDPLESQDTFTFPKAAAYTLRISGKPGPAGSFQPFTLNYTVRVTGGAATTQPFPPLLWAGLGLGIALILLAAYAVETSNSTSKRGY
ncbi:MAG: hypothetical protein WDN27_05725 [Candidatus Saccharibacteria bacterium]